MANPIGRPMKYGQFIEILEDDRIYSPATIVAHGERHNLVPKEGKQEELKKQRMRIRHSLSRFSQNHQFPFGGDGQVSDVIKGQPPQRGWYGHRWKEPWKIKNEFTSAKSAEA